MVQLSVQTGGAQERLGVDGAYRLIKECGFDGVDANIDVVCPSETIIDRDLPPVFSASEAELLEAFRPWKDGAEAYGLSNFQAHAPFPSCYPLGDDPAFDMQVLDVLQKTVRACDYIDCRRLIIHPFFHAYEHRLEPEVEWQQNIERYSALIPAAKEYGVTICLENMFVSNRGKLCAAICSDPAEACRYIDTLNDLAGSKVFGFCLDIGHLQFAGLDPLAVMRKLGSRIDAFHVHDNDGWDDEHIAPFTGVTNWDSFCQGLAELQFSQPVSFETFAIWDCYPVELASKVMQLLHDTGLYFLKKAGL